MERRPKFHFDVIHGIVRDWLDVGVDDLIDVTPLDPIPLQQFQLSLLFIFLFSLLFQLIFFIGKLRGELLDTKDEAKDYLFWESNWQFGLVLCWLLVPLITFKTVLNILFHLFYFWICLHYLVTFFLIIIYWCSINPLIFY
jgi:hypothetical protein